MYTLLVFGVIYFIVGVCLSTLSYTGTRWEAYVICVFAWPVIVAFEGTRWMAAYLKWARPDGD